MKNLTRVILQLLQFRSNFTTMRLSIVIFIAVFVASCGDRKATISQTDKKPDTVKAADTLRLLSKSDTSRLIGIFGDITNFHDSFVLSGDSVIFMHPDSEINPQYYYLNFLIFDSLSHRYIVTAGQPGNEYGPTKEKYFNQKRSGIKVEQIGRPNLKYAVFPNKRDHGYLKELLNKCFVQFSGGKYYFIEKIFPRVIYSFDPNGDKLSSFIIPDNFWEITGFMAYDIDDDRNPEFVLFSIGITPRSDAVDVDVYSLRNDSISVVVRNP